MYLWWETEGWRRVKRENVCKMRLYYNDKEYEHDWRSSHVKVLERLLIIGVWRSCILNGTE